MDKTCLEPACPSLPFLKWASQTCPVCDSPSSGPQTAVSISSSLLVQSAHGGEGLDTQCLPSVCTNVCHDAAQSCPIKAVSGHPVWLLAETPLHRPLLCITICLQNQLLFAICPWSCSLLSPSHSSEWL